MIYDAVYYACKAGADKYRKGDRRDSPATVQGLPLDCPQLTRPGGVATSAPWLPNRTGPRPRFDVALGFALPGRDARGRLVRLGPALGQILSAHDYPAPIAHILGEALVLTALLGATLKDAGGQLTLQAQTEAGVIDLLVCDYRGGELRGYVRFDPERLAEQPSQPSLLALFGKGYLAITFDQAVSGERYQGIVPLEGGSLAEAAEHFFSQSEQIPSLVRLAVDPKGRVAGGILLQHLPEGEEGRDRLHTRLDHPEWSHVRILAETVRAGELTDRGAAARGPALAAVPRRGGDPHPLLGSARPRLPLQRRACARRPRPLRARGARRNGRRRRLHQRRLRILLAGLSDPAYRSGGLSKGRGGAMRATAILLTIVAAAAAIWFWLVAAMIVSPPGGADELIHDTYYAVMGANYRLPYLLLALVNAAAVLALARGAGKRGALWFVLAGAALLLVAAGMHYWWAEGDAATRRVPEHSDAAAPWPIWAQYGGAWLGLLSAILGWLLYAVSRFRAPRRIE